MGVDSLTKFYTKVHKLIWLQSNANYKDQVGPGCYMLHVVHYIILIVHPDLLLFVREARNISLQ